MGAKLLSRLRGLGENVSWVVVVTLFLLLLETLYILSRPVSPSVQAKVEQKYPVVKTELNAVGIDDLQSLSSHPPIAPAGGRHNPFIP